MRLGDLARRLRRRTLLRQSLSSFIVYRWIGAPVVRIRSRLTQVAMKLVGSFGAHEIDLSFDMEKRENHASRTMP
jgi:hypothetical protein